MNRRNFFRVLGVGALAVPAVAAKASEPLDEPVITTRIYPATTTEGNAVLHIPDHTHSIPDIPYNYYADYYIDVAASGKFGEQYAAGLCDALFSRNI